MRYIFILMLLLLSSEFCFAADVSESHHGGRIYDEVLTMCLGSQSQTDFIYGELKKFSNVTYQTAQLGMLKMEPIIEMAKNRGLSAELNDKLNSEAFYAGIDACFPNDSYRKFLYISLLIGQELDARLAGAGLAALMFWAPVKLIGVFGIAVGRMSGAWARAGGYMMKALNVSLYAGTAVSLYFSVTECYDTIATSLHPGRNLKNGLAEDRDKVTLEVIAAIESQILAQKTNLEQGHLVPTERQDLERKIAQNEELLNSLRQKLHIPVPDENPFSSSAYSGI